MYYIMYYGFTCMKFPLQIEYYYTFLLCTEDIIAHCFPYFSSMAQIETIAFVSVLKCLL